MGFVLFAVMWVMWTWAIGSWACKYFKLREEDPNSMPLPLWYWALAAIPALAPAFLIFYLIPLEAMLL